MPSSVAVSCTYSEHKLIGSSSEIRLRLKGGLCFLIQTYDRLYTRHFRKEGVNAVYGEQVQVLSCPGAVAQPAEHKKRIPLRMIRGNKSVGEGSSLGLFEDFSIPPAFSFKEIIELDESLAKP